MRIWLILFFGITIGGVIGWRVSNSYYLSNYDLLLAISDASILQRDIKYLHLPDPELRCSLARMSRLGIDYLPKPEDFSPGLIGDSHLLHMAKEAVLSASKEAKDIDFQTILNTCKY